MCGEEGEGEEEEGRGLPSLTVAVKVWAPTYLLALAIGSYIGTIGVYWDVAWGMNLQGRGVGSRNVCLHMLILSLVFRVDNNKLYRCLYSSSLRRHWQYVFSRCRIRSGSCLRTLPI